MTQTATPWLPLPLSLEAVTPAWLGAALSDRHPGTAVKSIDFGNRRDGTSTSGRLAVEYAGASALPSTPYIKGGFVDAMPKRVWAGLEIEARFFEHVAPDMCINIPKGYFAGVAAPGFDEAWLSYRQNLMYGVGCCVANPYDMQNEEVTCISSERVLAVVCELDAVGSPGL